MKKIITDINNKIYFKEYNINNIKPNKVDIEVLDDVICDFYGFGGALTESTCYNLSLLTNNKQNEILNYYFNKNECNYNYIRLTIGSCDFSLSKYEYAHLNDLSDFSIEHDEKYIIPYIKKIKKIKDVKIISSPWKPPDVFLNFFKFLNIFKNEKYSEYLKLYIEAYKENNINIDYITMQNEPNAIQRWESCYFSLRSQKRFIYKYLINKLDYTKILLWDHNKENLFKNMNYLYIKNKHVAGIAYHYYTGEYPKEVRLVREKYNDVLMIHTEGCCGYSPYNENEWIKDAEIYSSDIVSDLSNGTNAYVDWNMLLDYYGGPSKDNNNVKAPIILNKENNDYILTPIFYYIKHFSHFIGNKILKVNNKSDLLVLSSCDNNNIYINIVNNKNYDRNINILVNNKYYNIFINSHSIISLVSKIKDTNN